MLSQRNKTQADNISSESCALQAISKPFACTGTVNSTLKINWPHESAPKSLLSSLLLSHARTTAATSHLPAYMALLESVPTIPSRSEWLNVLLSGPSSSIFKSSISGGS